MTSKTIADLNSEADTNLADNTAGDISAGDVRGIAKNLADSALNRNDDLGYQTIVISAAGLLLDETSPPGALTVTESTTNKVHRETLPFDGAGSSKEYGHFGFSVPKGVNEAAADIQYRVRWTSSATDTDSVVWGLQFLALGDGDALDQAYGTAQEVTDAAQSTADDEYVTGWSSSITPAGTLTEGDRLYGRLYRDPDNVSDTMAEDAGFIEVEIRIKYNSLKDD